MTHEEVNNSLAKAVISRPFNKVLEGPLKVVSKELDMWQETIGSVGWTITFPKEKMPCQ